MSKICRLQVLRAKRESVSAPPLPAEMVQSTRLAPNAELLVMTAASQSAPRSLHRCGV